MRSICLSFSVLVLIGCPGDDPPNPEPDAGQAAADAGTAADAGASTPDAGSTVDGGGLDPDAGQQAGDCREPDNECPAGQVCDEVSGECQRGCQQDSDCPDGMTCNERNRCVGQAGDVCEEPGDCFDATWEIRCIGFFECTDQRCIATCDEQVCGDQVCRPEQGETPTSCAQDCNQDRQCAPMLLWGKGACDMGLGFRWNGQECESVSGCECAGPDCDRVFPSFERCFASQPVECQGGEDECGEGRPCDDEMVCIEGRCEPPNQACQRNEDCPPGLSCVENQCVFREITCNEDNPCPEGLECLEGICLPGQAGCENDEECGNGMVCLDNMCVPQGMACDENNPCPQGMTCENNNCRPEMQACDENTPCPEGFVCENRMCRPDGNQCPAEPARAVAGDCDPQESFGWRWNGEACEELVGCACEGAACDFIAGTQQECEGWFEFCR